jgi:MtN3 and saliva related transmembrane protein
MRIDVELIGSIAGFLSSVTFLPQVIKTYKSKSAKDISLPMFLIVISSVILWLIYGALISNRPIIYTNSAVLIMGVIMIVLKLKYGKQ